MNDGGVCRTAPATPGLLIIYLINQSNSDGDVCRTAPATPGLLTSHLQILIKVVFLTGQRVSE